MQAATLTSTTPAEAAEPVQLVNIDTLAKTTAHKFGVNETHFDMVMEAESQGNITAVGDHGQAYSLMQFHLDTFDWLKSLAIKKGEPFQNLSYTNPQDQLTLGAWAFANGYADEWSTYRKFVKDGWQ